MPTISATVIQPKLLSVNKLRGTIFRAVEKEGKEAVRKLNITTSTWKESKPNMQSSFKYAGGNIILNAGPVVDESERSGYLKWKWLNYGTEVRYAHMGKGFKRKTNPWQLKPGPGGGPQKPIYITRRRPLEGIDARHWDILIQNMMSSRFRDAIQDAVRRGLQP